MWTDSWWDELGRRLSSAEWFADTGLPLAVTLIGLAVAVYLVRRQLRSDIALRKAERRTRATDPLADQLIESGRNLLISRMGGPDPFWESTDWQEGHIVIGAYNSARDLIRPDGDLNQVLTAALRTHRAWVKSKDLADEIPEARLRHAQVSLMGEYGSELHEMGTTLRRWDGLLPVPFSEQSDTQQVREDDEGKLEATYLRVVAQFGPRDSDESDPASPSHRS